MVLPSQSQSLAVVDLGKSRAKVSIISAAGELLAALDAPAAKLDSRGSRGLIDIAEIGRWCEDTLIDLYRRHPFQHLIPVTHGATAVIIDRSGKPWPVIDYEAAIDPALSARYDELRPRFAESGSPALPAGLNLGRQLYAQQSTAPDGFAQAQWILTYPQYWTWRWSGALGTDISSLGCHTDLWQPHQMQWSRLSVAQGWHDKFPPLVKAGAPAGRLLPEIAPRLLADDAAPDALQIHYGVHDSNAALAAFLGATEPFTLLSTGTWLVAFAVGTTAATLNPKRDTLWNIDVKSRAVAAARCMAGREREAIAGSLPAGDLSALELLLQTNTMALPAFAGAGPFPNLIGSIEGDIDALSDGQRAALASLYLALTIDAMLDLIGSNGSIIVEGPLARDEAALAALAVLRPRQTVKTTAANCVAHGAARLVFGEQQLAVPTTRTIEVPRQLIEPINTYRQRWQQIIAEKNPS